MDEKCCCGMSSASFPGGAPYRDPGFRKVTCAKCGKVFLTDIKGKTCCFECEK